MLFTRFFEPKPVASGFLPEAEGHRIFWQQYGNPQGVPVLSFHGGPGSSAKPKHASLYDLRKCRVILFDQRGCGRSTAVDPLAHNTAAHLLGDALRLLNTLEIDRAIIAGSSWGSTLALLFAQAYAARVSKLFVSSVWLCRKGDIDWITQGIGRLYPDIMARLTAPVPAGMPLRRYYAALARTNLPEATRLYGAYERIIGQLKPEIREEAPTADAIKAAAIYLHYDGQDYTLSENQILQNMPSIAHIPALLVHNREDLLCPVDMAYELAKHFHSARLVIVPDRGHGSELMRATSRRELRSFI